MTNKRLHALEREYHDQSWEHDDFDNWVEKNFPTVAIYLRTPDSLGLTPVAPEIYDIQVILKAWQVNHAPIACKVTRITKTGFSYITENDQVADLISQISHIKERENKWWDMVDNGTEKYTDEVYDTFLSERKETELQLLQASRVYYG